MKTTTFAALALILSTGCAPMQLGAPVVTDASRGTQDRVLPTASQGGALTQNGTQVSVDLVALCDIERVNLVDRTTERQYENGAPQNDVWAGIGGVLLGGAGAFMLASPSTFADKANDDSKLSPKEVRGVGYATIGVAALLLAVPVIDYIRSHRVAEHRVERIEEPGPVLRRNEACGHAPNGTAVFARLPAGGKYLLGKTDISGKLIVDLDATPSVTDWHFEPTDHAQVHTATSEIGEIALAELYASRDEAAWRELASTTCAAATTVNDCAREQAYANTFRHGAHLGEARALLEGVRLRQLIAEEDRAWSSLDLDACRKPAEADGDSDDVAEACRPLFAFSLRYPASAHAELLANALAKGRAAQTRLEQSEARRTASVAVNAYAPVSAGFIEYAGNGGGPTQCADGEWSHSSGRGTCSHHGGVGGGGGRSAPRPHRSSAPRSRRH